MKQVAKAYGDRVRFVWHDLPLPFHEHALPAARAAREARRQKGDAAFWKIHDTMFADRTKLARSRSRRRRARARPRHDEVGRRARRRRPRSRRSTPTPTPPRSSGSPARRRSSSSARAPRPDTLSWAPRTCASSSRLIDRAQSEIRSMKSLIAAAVVLGVARPGALRARRGARAPPRHRRGRERPRHRQQEHERLRRHRHGATTRTD